MEYLTLSSMNYGDLSQDSFPECFYVSLRMIKKTECLFDLTRILIYNIHIGHFQHVNKQTYILLDEMMQ